MWVLKFHGETFYVNHVDCEVSWSTKETVDNPHTKGSIKVKNCLLQIDNENCARITQLTLLDKVRLRNQKLGITRVLTQFGSAFHRALNDKEFKHSPFKKITGACSSTFMVCDLLNEAEVTMAVLKYQGQFRILQPNEGYYQAYDNIENGNIPVDYADPDTPYEYS
jgi:hypothetical protein